MNDLYSRMGDPNGNFNSTFQRNGFHSRTFELACFAYLESAGFSFDRSHEQPDFLVSRDGCCVAIEATTSNPQGNQVSDISIQQMEELSWTQLMGKVAYDFPKRMISILRKKLNHRYHKLPHCAGKPLVLMVAPFFESGSVFYPDEALIPCLYDIEESPLNVENIVPFFNIDEARSVSAVLYCNAFTVPRFFRLATNLEKRSDIIVIRKGVNYFDDQEHGVVIKSFVHQVGSPSSPHETWSEGVSLFENPYATIPLSKKLLPSTCTFTLQGNYIERNIHGFHPVVSFMEVHVRS